MRLGHLTIRGPLVLAPMAKFTHSTFRCLCKEFGADLVYTEFVMARDVARGDKRALGMLRFRPEERPIVGQICSADASEAADAAARVEALGFDAVDLNLDCQAQRVLALGAGGALHGDLPRLAQILRAAVEACHIPFTVKMRSGLDAGHRNAVEVAKLAEDCGVAAVAVHARTVQQGYKGEADWSIIRAVKTAVRIPVMGSGNVRTAGDVKAMFDATGCDAVMIARGSLGYPWIFREARSLLTTGKLPAPPSNAERLRVLLHAQDLLVKHFGKARAFRMMPQWACYFAKALPGYDDFRQQAHEARTLEELEQVARQHFLRLG